MNVFSAREIEYLKGQPLGRLATVGRDAAPHVVPITFHLDPNAEAIVIGGYGLAVSKKWRDLKGNPAVAFVVDDLARLEPWTPRGLEVRGRAELHDEGGERLGQGWAGAWLKILPRRIISWGIEGPVFSEEGRRKSRSVDTDLTRAG